MAKATKTKSTTEHEQDDANGGQPGEALVVRTQDLTEWTPRFVQGVDEAVALEDAKVEFMQRVMKEGEHYGKIPGGGKKPVLLKPGAEKLNASMGLHPVLTDAEPPVRDYTGEAHGGQPFWSFRRVCRIYRQTGAGEADRMLIAQAEGSCNSYEVKYRYREQKRKCPVCGVEAIQQSRPPKEEPNKKELAFYCWKKIGGCGANFRHDEPRIVNQQVGRVLNMDVFDLENTGLKMADKRALVAGTLLATGFSTIFTQDLEDRATDGEYDTGPSADDTQSSTSVTKPAAPAPKVSGSAQAAPAPSRDLTPEELAKKLLAQVVTALGNSLEPQWPKERYAEAFEAMGQNRLKLVGLLVELHDAQHGQCEHIAALPSAVDYVYPGTDEERAYTAKVKGQLHITATGPATDPAYNADEIPF